MSYDKIKHLIAQARVKDALTLLIKTVPAHQKNDIILLQGRWNGLERSNMMGLLSDADLRLEQNRLRAAALSFCEENPAENDMEGSPSSEETPKVLTKSILFVGANPKNSARLQTDVEYKAIKDRLKQAGKRDFFQLKQAELAVTIEDLMQALAQNKPDMVHFSGHGTAEGIQIASAQNEPILVRTTTLCRLFRQYKNQLKIILLNACFSESIAQQISEMGFFAIGINDELPEEVAISFAIGFYLGWGEGKSIELAYEDGLILVETNHPTQTQLPSLWKGGIKINV
jgi:CHAT domain-containing protein